MDGYVRPETALSLYIDPDEVEAERVLQAIDRAWPPDVSPVVLCLLCNSPHRFPGGCEAQWRAWSPSPLDGAGDNPIYSAPIFSSELLPFARQARALWGRIRCLFVDPPGWPKRIS